MRLDAIQEALWSGDFAELTDAEFDLLVRLPDSSSLFQIRICEQLAKSDFIFDIASGNWPACNNFQQENKRLLMYGWR